MCQSRNRRKCRPSSHAVKASLPMSDLLRPIGWASVRHSVCESSWETASWSETLPRLACETEGLSLSPEAVNPPFISSWRLTSSLFEHMGPCISQWSGGCRLPPELRWPARRSDSVRTQFHAGSGTLACQRRLAKKKTFSSLAPIFKTLPLSFLPGLLVFCSGIASILRRLVPCVVLDFSVTASRGKWPEAAQFPRIPTNRESTHG